MTTTVALLSQSIGTGINIGENLVFATSTMKKTKESATTAFTVEGKLTNGAASYDPGSRVRLWYGSSGFNVAYDAAAPIFRTGAGVSFRYVDLIPSNRAGDYRIRAGDLVTLCGQYMYCWVDSPVQLVAQILDINFVELP